MLLQGVQDHQQVHKCLQLLCLGSLLQIISYQISKLFIHHMKCNRCVYCVPSTSKCLTSLIEHGWKYCLSCSSSTRSSHLGTQAVACSLVYYELSERVYHVFSLVFCSREQGPVVSSSSALPLSVCSHQLNQSQETLILCVGSQVWLCGSGRFIGDQHSYTRTVVWAQGSTSKNNIKNKSDKDNLQIRWLFCG